MSVFEYCVNQYVSCVLCEYWVIQRSACVYLNTVIQDAFCLSEYSAIQDSVCV